jgi:hypothetical protein
VGERGAVEDFALEFRVEGTGGDCESSVEEGVVGKEREFGSGMEEEANGGCE